MITTTKPRIMKHSVLTDATIYNFRENRINVRFIDTWMIELFMGTDNIPDIKFVLSCREPLHDDAVSETNLEEFSWGHYVNISFFKRVQEILISYGYQEIPNDIVLMLLVYKYFMKWTVADLSPVKNYGVIKLIESLERQRPDALVESTIQRSEKKWVDESAAEFKLLLYTEFIKHENNARFIKKLLHDHYESVKLVETLITYRGGDKGHALDALRRKVIMILFVELKKWCALKCERHKCIGSLLALVDGEYLEFDSDKYNHVIESYGNRFRHFTSKLD